MDKKQQKLLALGTSYLSDLTLIAWLYFKASNYGLYNSTVKEIINSPDFQIQLYKVLLQSLTFMLLLFFIGQTLAYVFALRKFRAAYFYLKIFSVFGFAMFSFVAFFHSLYALLPMAIYLFGYYVFARDFKETSVKLQTLPQPPTP